MAISLNPKTFSAGGLLNDADVEIVSSRFTVYDYNGMITDPAQMSVALRLEMKTLEAGEEHVEYFSLGRAPDWMIDNDGKTIDPVAGKKPNSNSVFSFFVQSLLEAGFDDSLLDSGDISVLEGLKVHVIRKAAPESWKNLPGMKKADDKDKREKTYLAVDKILSTPSSGKQQAKPGQNSFSQSVLSKLEQILMEELPADGKPLKIKILQIGLMKRKDLTADDRRSLNEAIQKGALDSIDVVKVDGDSVSLSVF